MSIETTINLQVKDAEKLLEAVEKTGCSKSKLVVSLIERAICERSKYFKSFERIKYQKRDPERLWVRPHIWLREDEYEYALDLRKFFKMSFSAIIALAIDKYLDDVVRGLLYPEKAGGDDNYRAKNYILVHEVIDEIISWRIYWGNTPEPCCHPSSRNRVTSIQAV